MDFLQLGKKFLEIKSISEEGNEEAVNFLIPIYEQLGAKLVLQQVPHSLKDHSKRQYNLLGIWGDDLVDSRTKKGLLLTGSVDTSAPGNPADWTELKGHPFSPIEKDGLVYGLGAVNSKLNFMAMLASAEAFSKNKFLQPLYISATCGGESVLAGSKYLIQSGAVNPKQVIVSRPTGLKLQVSEKAQLTFQIRLSYVAIERDAQEFNAKVFISSKSKSAHSAHGEAAKNSLENVLYFLENLKSSPIENKLISMQGLGNLNRVPDTASVGVVIRSKDLDTMRDRFRSISANHRDCHFEMRLGGTGDRGVRLLPDEIYSAISLIRAEIKSLNEAMSPVVDSAFTPDRSFSILTSIIQERDALELTIQLHLLPEFGSVDSRKEIERDFKERMQGISKRFRSISLECRRTHGTHRYFTDPSSNFAATLLADMKRAGVSPEHSFGNCSSEASLFAEKGYDVVAFGAGDAVLASNCPNEKVRLEDLMAGIRFYSRAIETFCMRGI